MNAGPIFIGGLSFSGKTQLRLMLTAHPNIVITRKTYMWTRFYGRFGDLSQPENFEACLGAMLAHKPMQVLRPDRERIRREFWQGQPTYARLFALFHQHHAESVGKPRWGDQLGSIEQYADLVLAAYPGAKIIHLLRDPRQRVEENLSVASTYRRGKVGWETAQWLRSARLARVNRQRYPESYRVVCYEQFFSDPDQTLREVYSFLEEAYFPAALALEETNDSSVQMTHPEQVFLQTYAREEMLAFGYMPRAASLSFSTWPAYLLVDWPLNLAGLAAGRLWGGKRKKFSAREW